MHTRLENDEDEVIMRMRERLTEILVRFAPEIYTKYVSTNGKVKTVLYIRLMNALYGILKDYLL